ncbi:MAG: hypothetical protein HGA65_05125 [Oscillochloris sp.]|nr:hypothetical protein [Oscillochloris sp.]
MDDVQQFMAIAGQAGFRPEAAAAAMAWARERLTESEQLTQPLYVFRSAGSAGAGGAAQVAPARPRVLLAFRSADAALGFAQASGLGRSPRLAALGLGHLLAALIQRPAIGTLLVASDIENTFRAGLPDGSRIERAELLDQLQIADCRL